VIILGFRTTVRQLAMVTMLCAVCGNTAAQAVSKRSTKFSLFFIPLFPVRRGRYDQQCTFCGAVRPLDADEALRLAA
jgi:hypothetical protein